MDNVVATIRGMPTYAIILIGVGMLVFLLLPAIVALAKRTKDKWLILAINVLFFYAVEAWLPLMIWASTGSQDFSLIDRLKRSRKEAALSALLLIITIAGIVWGIVALTR